LQSVPIQKTSATEQIANELRTEIEDGALKPGEPFPSDAELAARFDVSKPTITKARAMLVALGLVSSRAGAASTVRNGGRAPVSPDIHMRAARRTVRTYPEGHYVRIVRAGLAEASPDIAAALGTEPGSPVIERRTITYAPDDTPLATSTTYFPAILADQCPALLKTERIAQGTTLYIEQQSGRAAGSLEAAVWCTASGSQPASPAALLRLPPDSYLLAVSTTSYDTNGVALAHEVELHPADTPILVDTVRH
jgi:DNA-binding GntR family transcriptional regulator